MVGIESIGTVCNVVPKPSFNLMKLHTRLGK